MSASIATLINKPGTGYRRFDFRRARVSLFYLAAYLFPLAAGLFVSPNDTFHLLGSRAGHEATAWRMFGALLFVLAIVTVSLIRKHQSEAYLNTAIVRLVFVALFSYLVGKTGNPAYALILIVLGFGEVWTLIALAFDIRELTHFPTRLKRED